MPLRVRGLDVPRWLAVMVVLAWPMTGRAAGDPAGPLDLLGNRSVLVAPADSTLVLKIGRGMPLRDALGATGRLAVAAPASVPARRYAKAARA